MHGRKFDADLLGLVSDGAAEQPVSTRALTPIVARPARAALREVNVTVSSKITPGTMPGDSAQRYPM